MGSRQLPIRLTEKREQRLEELSNRLEIGTKSKIIDESMRMAIKFLELQEEKKEEIQRINSKYEL
jgi:predicted DNA-binding protein